MTSLQLSRQATLASYFGLLGLILLWNTVVSREANIFLILLFQALPLLFPLRGLLAGKAYTHAWSSFLALYYFMLGVGDAYAGESTQTYGLLMVLLSVVFFISTMLYARHKGRQDKAEQQALVNEQVDALPDSEKDSPENDEQLIPWTPTIMGTFALAPVGFMLSSATGGSYMVMLLFPFVFYFLVMVAGFFASFALKVMRPEKPSLSAMSLLKGLNYFSFAAGLIACIILFGGFYSPPA